VPTTLVARYRAGVDPLPDRAAALHCLPGEWSLYWRDRNLAFHRYTRIDASPDVAVLLAEIEADPTGIFWG
jgi:Protein of unknown function (DUF3024)